MKWQEFVRDYLTFTRKERIGVLVILSLIILIAFAPKIFSHYAGYRSSPIDTSWVAEIKKLEKKDSAKGKEQLAENNEIREYQYDRVIKYNEPKKGELFYFDPNELSIDGWKKLGLRERTIQTIQNYLSKGGHFKQPEDLQKIYGLRNEEYERIAPYIRIESLPELKKEDQFVNIKQATEPPATKNNFTKSPVIDINLADTAAFIALPGIGSKLAARIVSFREKLGGFYSIDQIGETFGLADSTFQKIKQWLKLEALSLKKININTATVDELKAHPYIRWNLANPIIAYRNEHGIFSKLEDLKHVAAITDDIYKKILPYLEIQ